MSRKRTHRKKGTPNKWPKLILQGAGLVVVFTVAYWLARLAQSSEAVRMTVTSYGYVGVFIVSFISGLNLVVPLPAVAFLPVFTEAGLSYFLVATVMSAGMTVADAVGYGFGVLGRRAYKIARGSGSAFRHIESFKRRHKNGPLIALFLYASFAPLPNELIVIPMGILGYRLKRILPVVFAGNIVFNAIYAAGIIKIFGLV